MNQHRSYNLSSQDGIHTVTVTSYNEDDKPIEGFSKDFTNQQEAEDYMSQASMSKDNTTPEDFDTPVGTGVSEPDNTPKEKPASEMTEADAVALNADVHLAVPNTDNDRVVTDGERDQVSAGLHDKPEKGKPIETGK